VQIDRASLVKLTSFAGVAGIAGAFHHFGLDAQAAGWIGTALALLGAGAHAWVGHLGVDLLHDVARRFGRGEEARGVQNRDLHRLLGQTIAHILEDEAKHAPGGRFGAAFLTRAAAAFRGDVWMAVELTGAAAAVGEEEIPRYFSGDAEAIKRAQVLTARDWVALVEKVSGATRTVESGEAVQFAGAKLAERFAFELWESFKVAWKKDDLAWPALILRLLSLILGASGDAAKDSRDAAKQLAELRGEIAALRDAVVQAAAPAIDKADPGDIMLQAFRESQQALGAQLDRIEGKVDAGFAAVLDKIGEVKAALENPRIAPVKERWIGLMDTTKEILARDEQAEALLDALRGDKEKIVSITAPPGFGKSALLGLAVRMARAGGDPPEEELRGIAVLDARNTPPSIAELANRLGRITGLQDAASRFESAAAAGPDPALRELFFDFLRQAGKVWLVVENAEGLLAPSSAPAAARDFRDLLEGWCRHDHAARLLVLTRHAIHPAPQCHRRLQKVEEALLGGLPEEAAITLLRGQLADTRFRGAEEPLLGQVVQKLHRVPLAIEQFAGYLKNREEEVDLTRRFVEESDLLRLPAQEQILAITAESLRLLDEASLGLLRVVAWAGMPVPRSGLVALVADGEALVTRLVRSNQLSAYEGTAAEGRSYGMHAVVREALADLGGADGLDFERIREVFLAAGNAEWSQTQFRPALALYTLAERAARAVDRREQVAGALMNRGNALRSLGRLEEAVAAYDDSIALYRALVEQEHRRELRNDLARALMNRGSALADLGRLEEAVAAYDESIAIYRALVEQEHRRELRNELAAALMNRGIALRDLGRLEEAVAAYDESIALRRALVEQEHRRELRNDLALALYNLALAREEQGDIPAARAAAREACGLWEASVQDGMRHLQWYLDTGRALEARLGGG
jgi:tetratricopeptide (TPR) repeat protein